MKEVKKIGKWSVVIFFGAALILFGWSRWHWPKARLDVNGHTFTVLVAKSVYQQYRGLGKRDSIEPYQGMFFPFLLYGRQGIVMRDMRFSIDIIWLRDGVVVDLAQRVLLEVGRQEGEYTIYRPRADANAVLEVPAGESVALGIGIGTKIGQAR